MARLMSAKLTAQQVWAQEKRVTRRDGWQMLSAGELLTLCEQVRGRRPEEPLQRITDVKVTSVWRERLDAITGVDVVAEGFPDMTTAQFVDFFCSSHPGITPTSDVTRIAWDYEPTPTVVFVPLEPVTVADRFDQLPLHITLVPPYVQYVRTFRATSGRVADVASRWSHFAAAAGVQAMYGPQRSVPVREVDGVQLSRLHDELVTMISDIRGNIHMDDRYMGARYSPHVTDTASRRLMAGEDALVNSIAVARKHSRRWTITDLIPLG